jgi:hypothetical protein
MTLLETERFSRKISELLKQGGNPDIASKLAGDYAAACHAANLRLQQCEAMIKAGDGHQAIQLAETTPNLLDLVTVLEFRGADEWRSFCQQNLLPVADRIDARAVQALNECYARGITTDHPLYAAYRRAVLNRNDEDALKVLQSITRLNPTDANAASELSRLDAKVLSARLQHLSASVDGSDAKLVAAEVETIEATGFKASPNGETWRKAQAIRCEVLLEEISKSKDSSQWLDALEKIDFIHRLQNEFKPDLRPAFLSQLESMEAWARGEKEKDRKDREFKSQLAELRFRIQQSEEKDTSARYVKLPELREDYETLHKIWRGLADFARPIPQEIASGFNKRSALLEGEIYRRTAIQKRLILSGSTVILIIIAITAWFVLGQMKVRDLSRQLQAATGQRQVHAVERLLEIAHDKKIGNANTVAAAETFVAKENALLVNFKTAFGQLPQQFASQPEGTQLAVMADQLSQARTAFGLLAPDLKSENEPKLQAYEGTWQNYLAESGATVNSLLEQWVSSAEKHGAELDYLSPLDKTRGQLTVISDLIQKANDCESGFEKNLQLRADLLERLANVRNKFSAYSGQLKNIDDGLAAIQKARTIEEFSNGIKLAASSEFSTASPVIAAAAIQSLDASEEAILRFLLNATNASTWAYIEKEPPGNFIPGAVMPAEQQILSQLDKNPAVGADHHRYRLWLDSNGNNTEEWITAGALDNSPGWKRIQAWTSSATATSATFSGHDYGNFDGQYRLSPSQSVFRVEELGSTDETSAYHSVGLEIMLSPDGAYTKSLLEILDAIKDSRDGSPLFRAYLFSRLVELMKLQPDNWGLTFCPAIGADVARIEAIVGGNLSNGDWFLAAKANSLSQKLEQFFTTTRPISYTKQATGLLSLARAVTKGGLQYVGFIGLDGKPNLIEGAHPGDLWGYGMDNKQPVLLADANKPIRENAMLLSPLFTMAVSRQEFLTDTGVNPSEPSFQSVLPPLFQNPAQTRP